MNGNNVDSAGSKSLQYILQLGFQYAEIAVDKSVLLGTGKSRPSVHTHLLGSVATTGHSRPSANDDFVHSRALLPTMAEELLNLLTIDGTLRRKCWSRKSP